MSPQVALIAFRDSYSRLCAAMVLALTVGKHRERVRRAAGPGGLIPQDRYLSGVRYARTAANCRLDDAKAAGVSAEALIEVGREARRTIEGEWMVNLPLGTRG